MGLAVRCPFNETYLGQDSAQFVGRRDTLEHDIGCRGRSRIILLPVSDITSDRNLVRHARALARLPGKAELARKAVAPTVDLSVV